MRSLRGRSEQSNDIGESHVHVQSLESSNAGRANGKENNRSLWRSEHIRTRSSLTTHRGVPGHHVFTSDTWHVQGR